MPSTHPQVLLAGGFHGCADSLRGGRDRFDDQIGCRGVIAARTQTECDTEHQDRAQSVDAAGRHQRSPMNQQELDSRHYRISGPTVG